MTHSYGPVRTAEQVAHLTGESARLAQACTAREEGYAAARWDLLLALGFLRKLLRNDHMVRYLERHHGELLCEIRQISEN